VRVGAVLFGGGLAGLGGAYLSLQVVGSFTPAMTQGLGFLAIVVAMLARERVWVGILSALIYGVMVSIGTASQLTTVSIPSDVIEMAPFILVIVVLSFARFRTTGSAALGNSYIRM
jgi:simple sugar transport system permease protein